MWPNRSSGTNIVDILFEICDILLNSPNEQQRTALCATAVLLFETLAKISFEERVQLYLSCGHPRVLRARQLFLGSYPPHFEPRYTPQRDIPPIERLCPPYAWRNLPHLEPSYCPEPPCAPRRVQQFEPPPWRQLYRPCFPSGTDFEPSPRRNLLYSEPSCRPGTNQPHFEPSCTTSRELPHFEPPPLRRLGGPCFPSRDLPSGTDFEPRLRRNLLCSEPLCRPGTNPPHFEPPCTPRRTLPHFEPPPWRQLAQSCFPWCDLPPSETSPWADLRPRLEYQREGLDIQATVDQLHQEPQVCLQRLQPPLAPPQPPSPQMYRGRNWQQPFYQYPRDRERNRRRRSHLDDVYLPNYDIDEDDTDLESEIENASYGRRYDRRRWNNAPYRKPVLQNIETVRSSPDKKQSTSHEDRTKSEVADEGPCKESVDDNSLQKSEEDSFEETVDKNSTQKPIDENSTSTSVPASPQSVKKDIKINLKRSPVPKSTIEQSPVGESASENSVGASKTVLSVDKDKNLKHDEISNKNQSTSAIKKSTNKTDCNEDSANVAILEDIFILEDEISSLDKPVAKQKEVENKSDEQDSSMDSILSSVPKRSEIDSDEETVDLDDFITVDKIDTSGSFLNNRLEMFPDDHRIIPMDISNPSSPFKRKCTSSPGIEVKKTKSDELDTDELLKQLSIFCNDTVVKQGKYHEEKIERLHEEINTDQLLNEVNKVFADNNKEKDKKRVRSHSFTIEFEKAAPLKKSKSVDDMASTKNWITNFKSHASDYKDDLLLLMYSRGVTTCCRNKTSSEELKFAFELEGLNGSSELSEIAPKLDSTTWESPIKRSKKVQKILSDFEETEDKDTKNAEEKDEEQIGAIRVQIDSPLALKHKKCRKILSDDEETKEEIPVERDKEETETNGEQIGSPVAVKRKKCKRIDSSDEEQHFVVEKKKSKLFLNSKSANKKKSGEAFQKPGEKQDDKRLSYKSVPKKAKKKDANKNIKPITEYYKPSSENKSKVEISKTQKDLIKNDKSPSDCTFKSTTIFPEPISTSSSTKDNNEIQVNSTIPKKMSTSAEQAYRIPKRTADSATRPKDLPRKIAGAPEPADSNEIKNTSEQCKEINKNDKSRPDITPTSTTILTKPSISSIVKDSSESDVNSTVSKRTSTDAPYRIPKKAADSTQPPKELPKKVAELPEPKSIKNISELSTPCKTPTLSAYRKSIDEKKLPPPPEFSIDISPKSNPAKNKAKSFSRKLTMEKITPALLSTLENLFGDASSVQDLTVAGCKLPKGKSGDGKKKKESSKVSAGDVPKPKKKEIKNSEKVRTHDPEKYDSTEKSNSTEKLEKAKQNVTESKATFPKHTDSSKPAQKSVTERRKSVQPVETKNPVKEVENSRTKLSSSFTKVEGNTEKKSKPLKVHANVDKVKKLGKHRRNSAPSPENKRPIKDGKTVPTPKPINSIKKLDKEDRRNSEPSVILSKKTQEFADESNDDAKQNVEKVKNAPSSKTIDSIKTLAKEERRNSAPTIIVSSKNKDASIPENTILADKISETANVCKEIISKPSEKLNKSNDNKREDNKQTKAPEHIPMNLAETEKIEPKETENVSSDNSVSFLQKVTELVEKQIRTIPEDILEDQQFFECNAFYDNTAKFDRITGFSFIEDDCTDRAFALESPIFGKEPEIVKQAIEPRKECLSSLKDSDDVIEILPNIPLIDLTEDEEIKKEDAPVVIPDEIIPKENLATKLELEENPCSETITLYRAEETADASEDVQAVVASINPNTVLTGTEDVKKLEEDKEFTKTESETPKEPSLPSVSEANNAIQSYTTSESPVDEPTIAKEKEEEADNTLSNYYENAVNDLNISETLNETNAVQNTNETSIAVATTVNNNSVTVSQSVQQEQDKSEQQLLIESIDAYINEQDNNLEKNRGTNSPPTSSVQSEVNSSGTSSVQLPQANHKAADLTHTMNSQASSVQTNLQASWVQPNAVNAQIISVQTSQASLVQPNAINTQSSSVQTPQINSQASWPQLRLNNGNSVQANLQALKSAQMNWSNTGSTQAISVELTQRNSPTTNKNVPAGQSLAGNLVQGTSTYFPTQGTESNISANERHLEQSTSANFPTQGTKSNVSTIVRGTHQGLPPISISGPHQQRNVQQTAGNQSQGSLQWSCPGKDCPLSCLGRFVSASGQQANLPIAQNTPQAITNERPLSILNELERLASAPGQQQANPLVAQNTPQAITNERPISRSSIFHELLAMFRERPNESIISVSEIEVLTRLFSSFVFRYYTVETAYSSFCDILKKPTTFKPYFDNEISQFRVTFSTSVKNLSLTLVNKLCGLHIRATDQLVRTTDILLRLITDEIAINLNCPDNKAKCVVNTSIYELMAPCRAMYDGVPFFKYVFRTVETTVNRIRGTPTTPVSITQRNELQRQIREFNSIQARVNNYRSQQQPEVGNRPYSDANLPPLVNCQGPPHNRNLARGEGEITVPHSRKDSHRSGSSSSRQQSPTSLSMPSSRNINPVNPPNNSRLLTELLRTKTNVPSTEGNLFGQAGSGSLSNNNAFKMPSNPQTSNTSNKRTTSAHVIMETLGNTPRYQPNYEGFTMGRIPAPNVVTSRSQLNNDGFAVPNNPASTRTAHSTVTNSHLQAHSNQFGFRTPRPPPPTYDQTLVPTYKYASSFGGASTSNQPTNSNVNSNTKNGTDHLNSMLDMVNPPNVSFGTTNPAPFSSSVQDNTESQNSSPNVQQTEDDSSLKYILQTSVPVNKNLKPPKSKSLRFQKPLCKKKVTKNNNFRIKLPFTTPSDVPTFTSTSSTSSILQSQNQNITPQRSPVLLQNTPMVMSNAPAAPVSFQSTPPSVIMQNPVSPSLVQSTPSPLLQNTPFMSSSPPSYVVVESNPSTFVQNTSTSVMPSSSTSHVVQTSSPSLVVPNASTPPLLLQNQSVTNSASAQQATSNKTQKNLTKQPKKKENLRKAASQTQKEPIVRTSRAQSVETIEQDDVIEIIDDEPPPPLLPTVSLVDVKAEEDTLETIDLTWVDDLEEDVRQMFVKKEEPQDGQMDENQAANDFAGVLSPTDSGIASPPVQSDVENTVYIEKLCVCGKNAEYMCTCMQAWYCSNKCQLADWPSHKTACPEWTGYNGDSETSPN